MEKEFLLAVLTLPGLFDGEVELLEGMLEAGLRKLHVRKPGVEADALEGLLERLAPRWGSRLVLHGSCELAVRYRIPQVHGAVGFKDGSGLSGGGPFVGVGAPVAVSTSVHSWEEFRALPDGLAYAFLSPLFDSISKPFYRAGAGLLRQPAGGLPCLPMGLGGIGAGTIGEMLREGWKAGAVLGWIWDEPREAVERYIQLKKIIDGDGTTEGAGSGGL
jgi:thiamine-phosphate pyrophosphorylase